MHMNVGASLQLEDKSVSAAHESRSPMRVVWIET